MLEIKFFLLTVPLKRLSYRQYMTQKYTATIFSIFIGCRRLSNIDRARLKMQ
jgi:hypothetical protein